MMQLRQLIIVISLFPLVAYADDDFLSARLSSHEQIEQLLKEKTATTNHISICYNYACKNRAKINISAQNIQQLKEKFNQLSQNSLSERYAIAQAIAFLERISGTQSPVSNDKGKNFNDNEISGKMDCIDSTINTTHYLKFLENLKLLQWHIVNKPVYRAPFILGQHWAVQIMDINTGELFVVDSWVSNNGELPIIQELDNWKKRNNEGKLQKNINHK